MALSSLLNSFVFVVVNLIMTSCILQYHLSHIPYCTLADTLNNVRISESYSHSL